MIDAIFSAVWNLFRHVRPGKNAEPFVSIFCKPLNLHRSTLNRMRKVELSVCPEMIFRLRKPLGNKATNSDCPTGRKTSLFSNFFENLDNNNLWLWQGFAMEPS